MDDKSNSYHFSKEMPSLKEVTKKLHSESFGAESDSSKAKGKRPEVREEETPQSSKAKGKRPKAREAEVPPYSGLGVRVKPKPREDSLRHPQLVDYYILQHHESKAKQNEEDEASVDEASVHFATKERTEPLLRKRKSREAEVSHCNDSESRVSTAGNGRQDVSYAGNEARAKAKSSGSKESPAKVSDPSMGSSNGGSEDPSMGLGAGDREKPQEPFKSLGKGNEAGVFTWFKQKNFGNGNG